MNTELNHWIALNVLGWIEYKEEEYPHRDGYAFGNEHGEKCLAFDMPDYSGCPTAAMEVLKCCMMNLDIVTKRTDFQIVVLYDIGSPEPYVVTTDSDDDNDDSIHVKNCASANTMETAICRFAKNLYESRATAVIPTRFVRGA